jgi:superfamily II DNA/RNA helicase
MQAEDYVHRIGRTGRAGAAGRSLTLLTKDKPSDARFARALIKVRPQWHACGQGRSCQWSLSVTYAFRNSHSSTAGGHRSKSELKSTFSAAVLGQAG